MRLRAAAIAIASFLIAAQVVFAIATGFGFADKYALGAALEHALSAPNVDTLFVGTSRIKYGLDASRFDEVTAAKGVKTSSFLLAAPALSFVEMEYLLTSYFQERPCCIKYVFVEPDLGSDGTQRSPNSVRSILFFNLTNSVKAYRYLLQQQEFAPLDLRAPFSVEVKLTFLKQILVPLFRHYSNAGIFQSFIDDSHENFRSENHVKGYVGGINPNRLTTTLNKDPPRREKYFQDLAKMSEPYSQGHISDEQFLNFMKLMAYIRSQGAEPIILRPPQFVFSAISASVVARIISTCNGSFPVLDFGNPSENENLFNPDNRIDYDHLDSATVKEFSAMVADKFIWRLKHGGIVANCLAEMRQ